MPFDVNSLVGMKHLEAWMKAEAEGFTTRLTYQDGHYFVVTRDYNPQRVNFKVSANIVIEVYLG